MWAFHLTPGRLFHGMALQLHRHPLHGGWVSRLFLFFLLTDSIASFSWLRISSFQMPESWGLWFLLSAAFGFKAPSFLPLGSSPVLSHLGPSISSQNSWPPGLQAHLPHPPSLEASGVFQLLICDPLSDTGYSSKPRAGLGWG